MGAAMYASANAAGAAERRPGLRSAGAAGSDEDEDVVDAEIVDEGNDSRHRTTAQG